MRQRRRHRVQPVFLGDLTLEMRLERLCATEADGVPCTNPARWHILWSHSGDATPECAEDAARDLDTFDYVDVHVLGVTCSLPDAVWKLSDGDEMGRCVILAEDGTELGVDLEQEASS